MDEAELEAVDEAELEARDTKLEEVNKEVTEALPEEAEAGAEARPQLTEIPRRFIQKDPMLVIEILVLHLTANLKSGN